MVFFEEVIQFKHGPLKDACNQLFESLWVAIYYLEAPYQKDYSRYFQWVKE
uniref:Uncharacterized protein n=1 Tax=Helianthus annuus TaxID=4232 RepID=A0A251TNW0_HELAN